KAGGLGSARSVSGACAVAAGAALVAVGRTPGAGGRLDQYQAAAAKAKASTKAAMVTTGVRRVGAAGGMRAVEEKPGSRRVSLMQPWCSQPGAISRLRSRECLARAGEAMRLTPAAVRPPSSRCFAA